MHTHNLSPWTHVHVFNKGNRVAERGTRAVMWITIVMMVIEITAGWWFNSMALLADGWHMSSHAVAIGLSAFAYAAARRYAHDPRFTFGTWKIEILGGFASAIFLLMVAALMVWESTAHLLAPKPIHYPEAMAIATLGLLVNVVSALILGHAHDHHGHAHEEHDHDHHHHHDLNLKSAYVHVLADAATSLMAIAALGGGWLYGWSWLDPVMGMIGAVVVAVWAKNLLSATGKVLLDREMDHPLAEEIRSVIEDEHADGENRIADLHVWRVGQNAYACVISMVTHDNDLTADHVRAWLAVHEEIVHSTIEINQCPG